MVIDGKKAGLSEWSPLAVFKPSTKQTCRPLSLYGCLFTAAYSRMSTQMFFREFVVTSAFSAFTGCVHRDGTIDAPCYCDLILIPPPDCCGSGALKRRLPRPSQAWPAASAVPSPLTGRCLLQGEARHSPICLISFFILLRVVITVVSGDLFLLMNS